ncbi:MAG TPA: hypothetical protein VFT87_01375 [Candidatus Saccharimonadales bacterium]|nr:hypothetical protein [Candidatus Saccharimonadales bacterium]
MKLPSGEMPQPQHPDEKTKWYVANPESIETDLINPHTSPKEFASAYAAMQQWVLSFPDDKDGLQALAGCQNRAYEKLVATGYWPSALQDIACNTASTTDLQLAVFLLTEEQANFFPKTAAKVVSRLNVIRAFAGEHVAGVLEGKRETKVALSKFVHHTSGEHINFEAPQMLAVAQLTLMERLNLLQAERFDLAKPSRLQRTMAMRLAQTLHVAREKGSSYKQTPSHVITKSRALQQFWEDVSAYHSGKKGIGLQMNRRWRLEFDLNSRDRYRQYLAERRAGNFNSNVKLFDCLTVMNGQEVGQHLEKVLADLASAGSTASENIILNENLGILWAVASLRRKERAFSKVLERFRGETQAYLETYIPDGYPLLEENQAPLWMRYITLQSWMDQTGDGPTTVFTPQYQTVYDDRREAGQAMSRSLFGLYKQQPVNVFSEEVKTRSHGFKPFAWQLGVTVATHLYQEFARAPAMPLSVRAGLEDDLRRLLGGKKGRDFKVEFHLLPLDVQRKIASFGR